MTLFESVLQLVKDAPKCKTCESGVRRHARLTLLSIANHLEQAGHPDAAQKLINAAR